MRVVARRTGLTPHVIRVWERRYGAVSPERSPTNRRLYTDRDIERLQLLRQATLAGHSIGQVARLSREELKSILSADEDAATRIRSVDPTGGGSSQTEVGSFFVDAADAIRRLNSEELEDILNRASLNLSRKLIMEKLIMPLIKQVGDLWQDGSLRIANEHMATVVFRNFLGKFDFPQSEYAPLIVITTPAGQLHELGALLAAAAAAADGWRVVYLGPNLPAEEIAAVANQLQARAVGLSVVYPPDDAKLPQELKNLRKYLDDDVPLLVGGRVAGSYQKVLDEIQAVRLSDIEGLRAYLDSIRSQPTLA